MALPALQPEPGHTDNGSPGGSSGYGPADHEARSRRVSTLLDGYAVDQQVGFLLRRAHQRHAAIFLDGMAQAELTPTQFTALVKTVEAGRITQNHLGRLAAMDPATIQGVVRRLTERGLLLRTQDPADRRTVVLEPTAAGLALARAAVASARHITEATLAPFSAEERAQLLFLLRKMV